MSTVLVLAGRLLVWPQCQQALASRDVQKFLDAEMNWSLDDARQSEQRILAMDGGKPAIPALIHLLKDERAGVRQTAASVLREIGPAARAAVPELVAAERLERHEGPCPPVNLGHYVAWALKTIDPAAAARADVK